jgi:hypothetical protein
MLAEGAPTRPYAIGTAFLKFTWCIGAVQVVDADTQKAMMAWYYKKQEEEKVSTSCPCRARLPVATIDSLPTSCGMP